MVLKALMNVVKKPAVAVAKQVAPVVKQAVNNSLSGAPVQSMKMPDSDKTRSIGQSTQNFTPVPANMSKAPTTLSNIPVATPPKTSIPTPQITPQQQGVSVPKRQLTKVTPPGNLPVNVAGGQMTPEMERSATPSLATVTPQNKAAEYNAAMAPGNLPVTNQPSTGTNVDALRQAYLGTLQPNQDEKNLAGRITETNQNIANLAGQGRGISLDMIRGQQGALYNQGLVPLEAQLAKLVQARQAQSDETKAMLGFAEKDQEQQRATQQADISSIRDIALKAAQSGASQDIVNAILSSGDVNSAIKAAGSSLATPKKNDLISVGAGQTLYDPNTGQPVYTAPDSGGSSSLPNSAKEYEYARSQGYTGSYTDFQAGITPQKQQQAQQNVTTSLSLIDNLLSSPGLQGAVGAKGPSSLFGLKDTPIAGTNAADFIANLETVKNQLTLSALPQIKGNGTLSDRDIAILEGAIGALNPSMSEEAFRTELNRIGHYIAKGSLSSPQGSALYEQLMQEQPDASPQDIYEIVQSMSGGFNSAQTQALNGSNDAKRIAAAIKQVESGGNYNARGASTEGGAYQFMPATWKEWAGKYLGNPNAPMTPQNQDFVAESKIQDLINQGYDAQQIALIWNGGQPVVKKGVNQYGVAYDSGAYANKVIGQLGRA